MEFWGKMVISGLMNGSVYGLVAIGFVLIYKSSAVLNFAQGYMVLLGAYIFWTFNGALHFGVIVSILLTIPSSFIMGILIERLTLRPLIGQPLITMITVTIFLSLVIEGAVSMIWGTYPLQQLTLFSRETVKIGQFVLTTENLYAFGLAFGSMVALILFFRYSQLGLAMKGVAEGHQTMQSMGISVKRIMTMLCIVW